MAKKMAKLKAPADWWDSYGIDTPELRVFAIRVLSLTCSSSACERNWSTFNQIHTKRGNRLSVEKMNALAYIAFNKRLRERHLKKRTVTKDEELMVLDQCPSDDDWIACSDDEGDDEWMASGVGEGVATQGEGVATQGEDAATQGEGAATWGVGAATRGGSSRTYARGRKRKTTPGADAAREKAKGQLRTVEEDEEPIESESETNESGDERDIPYIEHSDESGGDGGGPSSFDPSFRHPHSDASMFH